MQFRGSQLVAIGAKARTALLPHEQAGAGACSDSANAAAATDEQRARGTDGRCLACAYAPTPVNGGDHVGGRIRSAVHQGPPGGVAVDDSFARLNVAELTIELATLRYSGGQMAPVRGTPGLVGPAGAPPDQACEVQSPWVAAIMGAGRSCTAWTISVLSIPRRYTEVIARSACPSWRWMTSSGTPSRDISTAWACLSWCGAKRRRTPARAAAWCSCDRTPAGAHATTGGRAAQHAEQRADRQRGP